MCQWAVIPLNAVPLIGVSTTMTTSFTTGEIPATTSTTAPNATEKLAKVMEDMTLQGVEIRKLHEEIQNIQKFSLSLQHN
jgi:alpha-D-ribose 1-methylphosphonate 5-phosphate C-P lyase